MLAVFLMQYDNAYCNKNYADSYERFEIKVFSKEKDSKNHGGYWLQGTKNGCHGWSYATDTFDSCDI